MFPDESFGREEKRRDWPLRLVRCFALLQLMSYVCLIGPTTAPSHAAESAPAEDSSGKVNTFDNYALTGTAYRSLHVDDLSQCVAACTSDSQCEAGDMNKWNGGCSLKRAGVSFRFDPRFVSVTVRSTANVPPAEEPMELKCLRNANLDGAVLSTASAANAGECSSVCENKEDCVAFSYDTAGSACKLFGSVRAQFDAEQILAGYKVQVTKGSEPAELHCFAPAPAPAPPPPPPPQPPAEPIQSQAEAAVPPTYAAVVAVGKLGRARVHWVAVWDAVDLEAAKRETLQRCSKTASQCQLAWASGPKCLALAYVRDGWSVQVGATKYEARLEALGNCQRINKSSCTIGGDWCNSTARQQ